MRLRSLLSPFLNRLLPPLVRFYLRKPRRYRHDGLDMMINPGVFHPGMYLSTRYFLEFIKELPLAGKSCLELGAGSGLISSWCARAGADMTASDISSLAIDNLRENAVRNQVDMKVLWSDQFDKIPPQQFDLIFINPPYYPGTPTDEAGHAWYCGPEFEYFQKLFRTMSGYVHSGSRVLMVLSEDCELDRIAALGAERGWQMEEIDRSKRRRWEWNYIFEFKQLPALENGVRMKVQR